MKRTIGVTMRTTTNGRFRSWNGRQPKTLVSNCDYHPFEGTVSEVHSQTLLVRGSPKFTGSRLALKDTWIKKEEQEMNQRVICVDFSVIMYEAWFSMSKKDYVSDSASEILEFTRQMADRIHHLKERLVREDAGDEMIFLMDSKNWRVKFYEGYYKRFFKAWKIKHRKTGKLGHMWTFDTYLYVLWNGETKPTKVTKKHLAELKKTIRRKKIEDHSVMIEHIPEYKGHRSKKREKDWKYESTYEEFKYMGNQLSIELAKTLGIKRVQVEGAEADDLSYAAARAFGARDLIVVTTDTDWDQLNDLHMFYRRFKPDIMDWAELGDTDLKQKAMILYGQGKDFIKPITYVNPTTKNRSTVGETSAYKLLDKFGPVEDIADPKYPWTKHPSFKRNLKLISLPHAPERILEASLSGIKNASIPEGEPKHLKEYGVSKVNIRANKRSGNQERDKEVW